MAVSGQLHARPGNSWYPVNNRLSGPVPIYLATLISAHNVVVLFGRVYYKEQREKKGYEYIWNWESVEQCVH